MENVMTNQNRLEIARRYIPEKVERLVRVAQRVESLQTLMGDLQQEVALDIIDGWTTGDKLLDFVLLACNGAYDTHVFFVQYRRLFDLALRKPGQRILVIQKAECWSEEGPVIMRNVYLATLRCSVTELIPDTLSIGIPVESGYFIWQEVIQNDYMINSHGIVDRNFIYTGPLHNQYCDFNGCVRIDSGAIIVPPDAVCDVVLLPIENPNELFEEHGIDQEMLNELHQNWIRTKSK